MGIDEFWLLDDSAESGSSSVEISETDKQTSEQSRAWQKRVKKDEKKSQDKDNRLYNYLIELLKDPSYDFIVDDIIKALYSWLPSFYILGVMSLLHMPISNDFRNDLWKEFIDFDYFPKEEFDFSSNDLDPKIRKRLTDMVDDILIISKFEPSSVMVWKFMNQKNHNMTIKFLSSVLAVFLSSVRVKFTDIQISSFSSFIIWEIEKEIVKMDLSEV